MPERFSDYSDDVKRKLVDKYLASRGSGKARGRSTAESANRAKEQLIANPDIAAKLAQELEIEGIESTGARAEAANEKAKAESGKVAEEAKKQANRTEFTPEETQQALQAQQQQREAEQQHFIQDTNPELELIQQLINSPPGRLVAQ